MSWGTDLWDQYENLSLHTQKGIDFLEKYGHFIRDRCDIEKEYATKLRKLVKTYSPKKKDEEDYQYSPCKAFKAVMKEVNDMAGQHELIAENLQDEVIREVTILVKDMKEDRKKHLQEGARNMTSLNNQILTLERARKNYEKAYKEGEKAKENFQKADADLYLSRADVEKQRMNMTIKLQQCEESKAEYANQLKRANELQNQHYHYLMPEVFRQLQDLDEKRIKNIKNFMIQSVDVERKVFPIINQCLECIVNAANLINEKEDTMMVIERYKSGYDPPTDIPFEDLSRMDSTPAPLTQPISSLRPESFTVKGTMSVGKSWKRPGIFAIFSSNKHNLSSYGDNKEEDFSDLPPSQRKKKLQMKIEEIHTKMQQESAAKDGLMKMKGVYEANPSMGDPMTIEGQLNASSNNLDKLTQELQKYQGFLEEVEGGSPAARRHNNHTTPQHNNHNGLQRPHRNSGGSGGEDDQLSRSASDSSVSANNNKMSAPGTPLPAHGCSNSPESGLGASHTSLPDSDDAPHSEYYDIELLPPLGTCRALYPFEATSEGSIPMSDGEELLIIEHDQGDGWTRVRRQNDTEEGFVPTSYIECTVISNC